MSDYTDTYHRMRMKAVDYYMRGMTKKNALLKAGYSDSVASTDAVSVFGRDDIKAEIERRRKRIASKSDVDAAWIVKRLMDIANADIVDLLIVDDIGNTRLDMSLMTPQLRRALEGEFSLSEEGTGNVRMRVKTTDKLRAIEMLGKYLDMFTDTVKVEGEISLIERLHAGRSRVSEGDKPEDELVGE